MRKPFSYQPLGHQAIREYRGPSKASNPATLAEPQPTLPTPPPTPAVKPQTTLERRRAALERALQQDTTAQRRVARVILASKNPGGYIDASPAYLLKQLRNEKTWKAECEARGIDPEKVRPPSRETVVRMIGHRED